MIARPAAIASRNCQSSSDQSDGFGTDMRRLPRPQPTYAGVLTRVSGVGSVRYPTQEGIFYLGEIPVA
jgi:hypothetical protein